MFFSFDGIDGAGKSTQLELFVEWLRDEGRPVTCCRDPGSTLLGEKLRFSSARSERGADSPTAAKC